jgi:hypothetical protein
MGGALSELQMGLLALGVAVVVGVFGFNKWQEIKHRKAGRGFESGHEDVLFAKRAVADAPQGEPVDATHGADARIEPHWEERDADIAPVVVTSKPAVSARADASATLDERIDYVAEIEFGAPLSGEQTAAIVAGFETARAIGCDGFNGAAQTWEGPVAGSQYRKIRLGLQLTDRGGPIREADLAGFQRAIDALATEAGAAVAWAGAQHPLTNAVELDAFCAEVDVQIGISLVAGATFAETKFRGLAEANGFVREDDGVFRRRTEDGLELLTLRQSAPAAVSLLLDVPRVPREAAVFGLMAHCARTLAKGLDARIVDDNQRALDDSMLAKIGQGVAGIHARMEAAGLPAGGALALRLFA